MSTCPLPNCEDHHPKGDAREPVYGEDWDRLNDAAKKRRLASGVVALREENERLEAELAAALRWKDQATRLIGTLAESGEWRDRVEALLDEYDAGLGEGRLAERIRAAITAPVGEGWRQKP